MSEKERRQKDILSDTYNNYNDATKTYSSYFDQESPQYITYYQICDESSKVDTTLYDEHEAVGSSSSLKYNRIKHVPVYKMGTPWDIATQLNESGLDSSISGSFVLLPSLNLHPREGEFFSIEYDADPELSQHLFRVSAVNADRATNNTKKFFQCSYDLYKEDTDFIYPQVVAKYVYRAAGNDNGVGDSYLISEESDAISAALKTEADKLIDTYRTLFYNEGMDTFTYAHPSDSTGTMFDYYWSPYLCHFLYDTSAITKRSESFLSEIYVQDCNESLFPFIYSEKAYRESIFYAVEHKDISLLDSLRSSFMQASAYDLSKPLSLPFSSSADRYILLDFYHPSLDPADFWQRSFHWLFGEPYMPLNSQPASVKYVKPLATHVSVDSSGNCTCDIGTPDMKDTLLYEMDSPGGLVVNDVVYANSSGDLIDAKLGSTISDSTDLPDDKYLLFNVVKEYLNGTLENKRFSTEAKTSGVSALTSFLHLLDTFFYEDTVQNYLLMPLVIYILQKFIV